MGVLRVTSLRVGLASLNVSDETLDALVFVTCMCYMGKPAAGMHGTIQSMLERPTAGIYHWCKKFKR